MVFYNPLLNRKGYQQNYLKLLYTNLVEDIKIFIDVSSFSKSAPSRNYHRSIGLEPERNLITGKSDS